MVSRLKNTGLPILKVCHKNMSVWTKLKFDNVALKSLPIDQETGNFVRQVPGACFSKVDPSPVENPQIVAVSIDALGLLDVKKGDLNEEFTKYFSGNAKIPGSETAAHCYCGHQFGTFAGQLGDGAAM